MRLTTRLLLLVLVCVLPVLAVQLYSAASLREWRQTRIAERASRQTELADGELIGVLDQVRGVAAVLAQLPEAAAGNPACANRLAALQRGLAAYRFLALYGPDGTLACASTPGAPTATAAGWAIPPGAEMGIGRYSTDAGADGAFLPVSVRLPGAAGAANALTLVAALDLPWLNKHLEDIRLPRFDSGPDSTLFVTDRDGTVLARFPEASDWLGRRLPAGLLPLVGHAAAGMIRDDRKIVASIPASAPPDGVAVIEEVSQPYVAADMAQTAWRDTLLLGLAVLAALGLAALAARRFIHHPTASLLSAARRWRDGDLSARAEIRQPNSEFGTLAQAFNAMVSTLQSRDLERRLQAEVLEAQVVERTSELSETNNRLQVEIAEREKTEAALLQAQKLQAVGQLAGGIAHDFNNMLATVLGSLELMERRVAPGVESWTEADADRLRKLIERASNAVQRGAQLTSRLLAFSRRQRLAARPTDLNQLITDLVTLATSTLGRRVRVGTDLASDLPAAMVDPSQIEAALLNLCLNARDAMPEGGELTIATATEILERAADSDDPPSGAYVRISVSDTGTGMPPEVVARAFEPFFTTKGPGGTGLGLAQVHGMARQSGGTVRIVSTQGVGTEIVLLLPRAAADAAATQPARAGDVAPRGSPAILVMVVDDDAPVRQVTVEMLKDLGFDAVQAGGAAEALVLLAQLAGPPDVILLDYAMPGMNGLQLARRLRERGLSMPIALVTGYAELAGVEGAANPLDAVLGKPFTIRELDDTLMRLRMRVHSASNVVRLRPRG
ncbi:MAG TPA: ATP-binding protein [Acetobacteraceae bacterium]|jgi:signal transduction histidine kinase/CheY-like chemotaxis protein